MKISQLDYLANPLRADHPFGKFSSRCCVLFPRFLLSLTLHPNFRDLVTEGDGPVHCVHLPVWEAF